MSRRFSALSVAVILFVIFSCSFISQAQVRNQGPMNPERLVTLTGNHHPLARPEFDIGPVAPDFAMERMIITLQPDSGRSAALEAFLEAQQTPSSPQFHQWLTPEDFASRFGVSDADLKSVTAWLAASGFTIEEIPAGGRSIVFSGTASQVEAALHTPIRTYNVAGEIHHANAADPQIPEALAGIVAGVVSLHDFRRTPMHANVQAAPEYTSGSAHYLAPADFAKIYDVAPLYSTMTGTGQIIAIAGRINIRVADAQAFRSIFGLPANNPVVVLNGPDPGIFSSGEEAEADLDVQWSGAVAPMATIKLVVSASTNSSDGIDLSSQYIVSHNVAPVMSVSFGSCETGLGSAERTFYNNLWQQAAAQGITVLVAAGDSGAAGCDSASETTATLGPAINGLCSPPYSVCVGGTEFHENGNNNLYWSASNNATSLASALSYIPEVAWNESGADGGSGLWATGGGASAYYTKPAWQSGLGVPADGKRDVPDIALSAAGHDGYWVNILGNYYIVSGTSAASPSFAGLMALVNQKNGGAQGNINATLYPLATLQAAGGAAVFHASIGGNNTVPGVTGFSVGSHYNQATGLGSPDAFVMVNHWTDGHVLSTSTFTLSGAAASSLTPGGHATLPLTVAVSGGFNAAIALSATGLPSGFTVSFAPASFAAPGSGASTLTISASSAVAPGTYSLALAATSGSQQKTLTVVVTVTPPFTVALNASTLSVNGGASGSVILTTTIAAGFSDPIALSARLPSGVTGAYAPSSIPAPGSGSSHLTLSVASNAVPGTYVIPIGATGGATVLSASLTLTIVQPTTFVLTATPSTLSIARGASGSTLLGLTPVGAFTGNVTISLSLSPMPAGITPVWSSGTTGPLLTFRVAESAKTGTYPITVTGATANVSPSPTVIVNLTVH